MKLNGDLVLEEYTPVTFGHVKVVDENGYSLAGWRPKGCLCSLYKDILNACPYVSCVRPTGKVHSHLDLNRQFRTATK